MTTPARYLWKRPGPLHFLAGGAVFLALYLPLSQLPGEDSGGLAFLPALLFCMASPGSRREWLLALVAALATTGAELAGMLAGYGIAGIWPPRALPAGSDAYQLVGACIALPGVLVGFTALHALGREPLPAAEERPERTLADVDSWHVGLLAGACMAALFAVMFAERSNPDALMFVPPGFAFMAFLVFLSSGIVLVTALPQAGRRKAALLARFGLSLLIGFIGYASYAGLSVRLDGDRAGPAVLVAIIAVHAAAPALGWWQIKRFARGAGLLQ